MPDVVLERVQSEGVDGMDEACLMLCWSVSSL